jgi:ATP-dependent Lon protease
MTDGACGQTKISTLEPTSAEYNISRNYLEWLTTLPWGVYTVENLNIHNARSAAPSARGAGGHWLTVGM